MATSKKNKFLMDNKPEEKSQDKKAPGKAQTTLKKVSNQKSRKSRKEYTEQEKAEAMENMRTSGLKGVKIPRINLALRPSNYAYLETMSKHLGQTKTELLNELIADSMKKNKKLYERLKGETQDDFKH